MANDLKEYLPKQEQELLIQAFVEKQLLTKARKIMKEQGHTIKDVVTAALKKYCDEFKSKS